MIQWIIPLAVLVLFEGIADYFAKNWSLHGGVWIAVISLASFLLGNAFWLLALKDGSGLGRGSIIFSVASAIIAMLLGLVLYHEKTNALQISGMILGIISLVLIFWE